MRERPVRYYRTYSSDYEDCAEDIASFVQKSGSWFDPRRPTCGDILRLLFPALLDEIKVGGAGLVTDIRSCDHISAYLTKAVSAVVLNLETGNQWERSLPGAWFSGMGWLPNVLKVESLSCLELFCNFWLRQYISKTKLETMFQCSYIEIPDKSLLDLSRLKDDRSRLPELFRQYPAIVINPLLLGRVASFAAGEDAEALFSFGFLLPLQYAQGYDLWRASGIAETSAIELKPAATDRFNKVVRRVTELYGEAAEHYLCYPMPSAQEYQSAQMAVVYLQMQAERVPQLLWSYGGMLTVARELYRMVWDETNENEGEKTANERFIDGCRAVEKVLYFFYRYKAEEGLAALDSAITAVETRHEMKLGEESLATIAHLRSILCLGEEEVPEVFPPTPPEPPVRARQLTELPPLQPREPAKPKPPPKGQGAMEF